MTRRLAPAIHGCVVRSIRAGGGKGPLLAVLRDNPLLVWLVRPGLAAGIPPGFPGPFREGGMKGPPPPHPPGTSHQAGGWPLQERSGDCCCRRSPSRSSWLCATSRFSTRPGFRGSTSAKASPMWRSPRWPVCSPRWHSCISISRSAFSIIVLGLWSTPVSTVLRCKHAVPCCEPTPEKTLASPACLWFEPRTWFAVGLAAVVIANVAVASHLFRRVDCMVRTKESRVSVPMCMSMPAHSLFR